MSVFFGLPDALCSELLSEWLDRNALGFLDSAVCSVQWRVQLLALLPVVKGSCCGEKLEYLQWINRRGITLAKLSLSWQSKSENWMAALASHWESVKSIELHSGNGFDDHINTCKSLISIDTTEERFICLNGDILRNLTDLSLNHRRGNTLEVLERILQNCRLLKHFSYEFDQTPETTSLYLDVVSQNADLVSVGVKVDETILQGLTRVSGQRLRSMKLSGRVSFNTMAYVVENFVQIESIDIHSNSGGPTTICYDKRKQSLLLIGNGTQIAGWERFASAVKILHELAYLGFIALNVNVPVFAHVRRIKIEHPKASNAQLKALLHQCTALTHLSVSGPTDINWPEVLSSSNVIEELTIVDYSQRHMLFLLSTCRYLTKFRYQDLYTNLDSFPVISAAIKNYRHATTGKPLVCSYNFMLDKTRTIHCYMEYDGSQFKGRLTHDNFEDMMTFYI